MTYTIAAFYRFVRISEPAVLKEQLFADFGDTDLLGTTLIAEEGVNGTMAASACNHRPLLTDVGRARRAGRRRGQILLS